jgi:hypothetical protein
MNPMENFSFTKKTETQPPSSTENREENNSNGLEDQVEEFNVRSFRIQQLEEELGGETGLEERIRALNPEQWETIQSKLAQTQEKIKETERNLANSVSGNAIDELWADARDLLDVQGNYEMARGNGYGDGRVKAALKSVGAGLLGSAIATFAAPAQAANSIRRKLSLGLQRIKEQGLQGKRLNMAEQVKDSQ